VGPRLPQLPGGGVQRLVLGVHHEVVPVQRELPGELAADSAGRAGDQGEWPRLSPGGRVTAPPPAKHRRGLRRPGHRSVPTGGDGRARRGRRLARIRTGTQEAPHPRARPCTGLTRRDGRRRRDRIGVSMASTNASDYFLLRHREWEVDHVFAYAGAGTNGLLAVWGPADNDPK